MESLLKPALNLLVIALFLVGLTNAHAIQTGGPSVGPLTVFVAKRIVTMEPALPTATAVAVSGDRIVAVGTVEDLQPWIEAKGARVDETFFDSIMLPGFIDPHLHPSLPAVLTQFPFIAPDDWSLPTGEFPGATTPQAYRQRLEELVARHRNDAAVPFIAWGYHPLWHGEIYREQLNDWFGDRPVMLWHRSFHELIGNDAALELLGLSGADVAGQHGVDWQRGHFWENGLGLLLPRMAFLFDPARYGAGMVNFLEMLHRGGVTTAMDMGVGIYGDPLGETALVRHAFEESEAPSRIVLTPIISDFLQRGVSPGEALTQIAEWTENSSGRVLFDNHFKLMMDGAIFSGLSQFAFPGYLDGHSGQWMAPLEVTYQWAEVFWNAGFQLHAHTNGDGSAAALIDIVRQLQLESPRLDHRLTLEHFAYATEDQVRQMAALGMVVSANPYYQYILSDIYADRWLGPDRARSMVPLGALKRAGVPFTLHSDSPMAPLSPLTLAWAAVNRVTINGNANHTAQRISVDDAMRAITIDAAWIMRWEDRVGSIRAGKLADFVVLEEDPYKVETRRLKDIRVLATVFEGQVHPVSGKR
jgi:predicted amidohydrolase YtcJ